MDRLVALFDKPMRDPTITGSSTRGSPSTTCRPSTRRPSRPSFRQDTSLVIGLQEISTQIGPQYFFDLERAPPLAAQHLDLRASPRSGSCAAASTPRWGGPPSRVNLPNAHRAEPACPPRRCPRSAPSSPPCTTRRRLRRAALGPHPEPLASSRASAPTGSRDINQWARRPAPPGPVGGGPRHGAPRRRWACTSRRPARRRPTRPPATPSCSPSGACRPASGSGRRSWSGISLDVTGFYKCAHPAGHPQLRLQLRPERPALHQHRHRHASTAWRPCSRWPSATASPGWLAYTFQRSLRTDPPDLQRPFDFDQPSNLTVLGTYQLGRGWSAGARFRLVSGQPLHPGGRFGLRLRHRGLRAGLRRHQQRPARQLLGPRPAHRQGLDLQGLDARPSTSTSRT